MKTIYLDNAATTQTYPEVLDAMLPFFTEHYGNPSSIYSFAGEAGKAVDEARRTIASAIGADASEIYFTGGGSESDNWALKATAEAYASKGKHIITSKIEHHAILHTCEWLERQGFEVTYLDVDENGCINPADVEAAIRPDTILISIMFANNEIGTIEPIAEIGAIARAHGVLFHTDAVQAFGQEPIQVDEMNIDMLSSSGHKLNGPKGIGFLYIRKGVKIRSFVHGGAQERKRRAGTENVPGIVGFGKAVELAVASMDDRIRKETELRDSPSAPALTVGVSINMALPLGSITFPLLVNFKVASPFKSEPVLPESPFNSVDTPAKVTLPTTNKAPKNNNFFIICLLFPLIFFILFKSITT